MTTQDDDQLMSQIENEEYVRKFDSHRPKFKGIPEGFYPNTWGNVLLIWAAILGVYGICAGIFALFLYCLLSAPTKTSWIFFGFFCGYVLIIISLILYGQMRRRTLEKEYIEKALKEYAKDNQS